MHRYLGGLLDPFVTLLEVHKLMYFMQVAGQPLKLKYTKAPYGPYAENLRHVLRAVEGHLISGYADGGDAPAKQIELVPGAVDDATAFLKHDTETQARFDRVADLVAGFETPFGLELLATVHWVSVHESVEAVDDVVRHTYAWNERKKRFSPRQIALAVGVLSKKAGLTPFHRAAHDDGHQRKRPRSPDRPLADRRGGYVAGDRMISTGTMPSTWRSCSTS